MLFSVSVGPGLLAAILFTPILGQISDEFQNPSAEYRPKFRYWLPDASVSVDIVTKDIHDARAAGAGGLELLPFYLYGMGEETFRRFNRGVEGYPVPQLPDWAKFGFGTPAFNSLLKSSLRAANEAEIVVDFALGANQGQGVPSEVGTPGLAVELLMGNTTISPKGSFSAPVPQARQPSDTILSGLNFMHPLEQFGTPNLTAVIAYQVLSQTSKTSSTGPTTVHLNQSSFINLMPWVKDDRSLQWTPPDITKTWKIFTFWEAYTNQRSCDGGPNATDFIGNGSWIVDHFSKLGAARITNFWDKYILFDNEIAGLLRSIGKYAWEDSMEILASLYWTPGLLKRFHDTHGYDLLPYLPLLFGSSNTWNGYLPVYNEVYGFGNDTNIGNSVYQLNYRKVLNDGYQDYLSRLREWTHSVGTEFSTQPAYNLPLQMLSDIPLIDAPEAESLGFAQLIDAYRQFSGPAHLTNKSVISTELGAVNTPAYSLRIPDLLQQIKRSFAGGFTMNVIHGFPTSTPYPNTTWPGYTTFFYEFTDMWNQIQPAWQHMRDSLDYIARNQWVLRQGSPQVDLAFYLYASPWSARAQYSSTNLRNLGYTYDYLGPDNLVSSRAFIKNKALGTPGYRALIFNKQAVISAEAAEVLIKMASAGLPIIFIGSVPNQPYPANSSSQSALTATMTRLLSEENAYRTESVDKLPGLLSNRGISPRVSLNCSSNPVYPVWRSSAHVEYIYFFNDQTIATKCTAKINASDITPYIYNAWTGSQSPLLQYTTTNSTIELSLALESNETIILALYQSSSTPKCIFSNTTGALQSFTSTSNQTHALFTGPATMRSSSGKLTRFNRTLPAPTNLTAWDLVIEDWHSAPDRFAVKTEITNHTFTNISLVPWNQLNFSSLRPVSGVGHYTTRFAVPSSSNSSSLVGILTLPLIQHTARAYLDGKLLQPIDPVNPVVQLGEVEGGSEHEIRIEVTTTLFNRIKAEANETMIASQIAGVRQPKYNSMPYQAYGLVGTVKLEWGAVIEVEC